MHDNPRAKNVVVFSQPRRRPFIAYKNRYSLVISRAKLQNSGDRLQFSKPLDSKPRVERPKNPIIEVSFHPPPFSFPCAKVSVRNSATRRKYVPGFFLSKKRGNSVLDLCV